MFRKGLAYYRWGSANVALLACPTHAREIFDVLNEYQRKKNDKA
jgi:hypothetical protein